MFGQARRQRTLLRATLSIVSTSLVLVVALHWLPASAHVTGIQAQSEDHSWCYGPSTQGKPAVRDAMAYAMNNLAGQTVMTEDGPGNCSAIVDVVFAEGFVGNGVRGEWECLTFNNPVCFKARVTLNKDIIDRDDGPYELNLQKTACHEVGHSVGLDHHPRPGDCMVTGAVLSGHIFYTSAHVSAINALYN